MGIADAEGEAGAGETVLHFDEPEHLIAGLLDRELHVVHADLSEAQRFYECIHHPVMRDDLVRGCRGRLKQFGLLCRSAGRFRKKLLES